LNLFNFLEKIYLLSYYVVDLSSKRHNTMSISEYIVEGDSFNHKEWIELWGKLREGPLRDMHTIKLGYSEYSSQECYFSWTRKIGADQNTQYTISCVDTRREIDRR
jgi:hypothetical protein